MSTRVATGLLDRRRALAAKRHQRRRTALLALVAGSAVVVGGWWVGTGPLLSVSNVNVSGYQQADQAQVLRTIQIAAREGTMLRLPTVSVREAAMRFAWVADVKVHHNWPRGVDVRIVEAVPIAIAVTDDGRRVLVSDSGRVLGQVQGETPALPQFRIPATATGEWLTGTARRAPFDFLSALSPGVARRVRDLRIEGGVVVGSIVDGPELRAGTPRMMFAKGRALEAVLSAPRLAASLKEATSLDVSAPKRPVLQGVDPSIVPSTKGLGSGSDDIETSSIP